MDKKPRVLFLSTGNCARSQMAEGFLRTFAGDHFDVVSAGIEQGEINPLVAEVMRDAGIDISKQRSKDVAESLKEHFGYVITVCDLARERAPIFPFTPHLIHWSIEDPGVAKGSAEDRREALQRVRDTIREKVQNFIDETSEREPEHSSAATG